MLTRHSLHISLLLVLILACCGYLYSLSLPGTFVLDDEANLSKLANIHLPEDWPSFWQYITTGNAGPLGRPVALFTFAIQYSAWPNNPDTFKITNIWLHLLNSLLVFCIASALIQSSRLENQLKSLGPWIALLTTGLYAIHPLQISTVAYVVQRMTLLGTLFSLFMLLAYLKARIYWNQESIKKSIIFLTLAFLSFIFAIYSKENTLTMLMVLPTLEITFLSKPSNKPITWRSITTFLPLTIMVIFLIIEIPKVIRGYEFTFREFNLEERILTESRIILDYLTNIIYPDHRKYSLIHDDFSLSTSIVDPISTLYSIIIIFSFVFISYKLRRNLPEVFSCITAYLLSHLLESSIWALELYYEHRNNFAIFFILFVISILLARLSLSRLRIAQAIAATYLATCFISGLLTSTIWSTPIKMISWWYKNHPQSYITESYMIDILFYSKNTDIALNLLTKQKKQFPILTGIKQAKFYCSLEQPKNANLELSALTITGESYETQRHHHTLAAQVNELADLDCTGIDDYQLIRIMSDLRKYAKYSDHPVINYKLGIFLYAHGKIDEGLRLIKMTFDQTNDIMTGIVYASISNEQGQFQEMNNAIAKLRTLPTNAEQKSIIDRLGKK